LDKVKFKDADGDEGKTDIDSMEIKNWRWMELHISFPPIAIFDFSLFETSDFRWNSVYFFFNKIEFISYFMHKARWRL